MVQPRAIIRIVMIVAAFAVVAMHVGMPDQVSMMSGDMVDAAHGMSSPRLNVGAMMTSSGHSSAVGAPSPASGHAPSPGMTMSAACQLLALACVVGLAWNTLIRRRGSSIVPFLSARASVRGAPRYRRLAGRPPDLSVLCVAIC